MIQKKVEPDRLEQRLQKLEQQVQMLIMIADYEGHPFICTCLEDGLSVRQLDDILALITEAEASMSTKRPMTYHEFVEKLGEIVPSQKNNPDFPKDVLKSFSKEVKLNRICTFFETYIA